MKAASGPSGATPVPEGHRPEPARGADRLPPCTRGGKRHIVLATCTPETPLDGGREPWTSGPCSPVGYRSPLRSPPGWPVTD